MPNPLVQLKMGWTEKYERTNRLLDSQTKTHCRSDSQVDGNAILKLVKQSVTQTVSQVDIQSDSHPIDQTLKQLDSHKELLDSR